MRGGIIRLYRTATELGQSKGRGNKFVLAPVVMLMQLQQLFEAATGLPAARQIDRTRGGDEPYETGPFYEFVAAVWPPVFGSDNGLSSALRKWDSFLKPNKRK